MDLNKLTLTRSEAQEAMADWLENYPTLPHIEPKTEEIRQSIQISYNVVEEKCNDLSGKIDYYTDVHFGLLLYEYLFSLPEFNLRLASNDDFWRYLSIKVVPNIVAKRWGKDSETHYWSKPSRIWLRSIWWYVHLSWQGSIEETEKVLCSPCFTTDSILNLEERTGRYGTYIEVYRKIMLYYSKIPSSILQKFKSNTNKKQDDLFRVIMRLNTAKVMVVDPALYLGGEKQYVEKLFLDAGVNVGLYLK